MNNITSQRLSSSELQRKQKGNIKSYGQKIFSLIVKKENIQQGKSYLTDTENSGWFTYGISYHCDLICHCCSLPAFLSLKPSSSHQLLIICHFWIICHYLYLPSHCILTIAYCNVENNRLFFPYPKLPVKQQPKKIPFAWSEQGTVVIFQWQYSCC